MNLESIRFFWLCGLAGKAVEIIEENMKQ